jgi:hypothetical protein
MARTALSVGPHRLPVQSTSSGAHCGQTRSHEKQSSPAVAAPIACATGAAEAANEVTVRAPGRAAEKDQPLTMVSVQPVGISLGPHSGESHASREYDSAGASAVVVANEVTLSDSGFRRDISASARWVDVEGRRSAAPWMACDAPDLHGGVPEPTGRADVSSRR